MRGDGTQEREADEGSEEVSPLLVRILAKIYAVNARVEAMKALNCVRDRNGLAQAYDDAQFFAAETELEALATEAGMLPIEGWNG